ncbi:PREDICTED: DDB1- and CUL4-associated factor 11 isoform X1 [Polistes dominula]|uniref:DDB1- and CUL4-associated factor 11 isoform X1 n=1 Tax=Polistes dominula TaxID=743375 RepID=A0ABM1JGD2_POLDO|nr:PREDICTED: DDB1- and CUL4-associated factor 11 isoform X1 [Polistes dominula]
MWSLYSVIRSTIITLFFCTRVIYLSCRHFYCMINHGQVHIIASNHDDSDEEYAASLLPPKIMSLPNTSRLDQSEISLATKQGCGLKDNSGNRNLSIASMIHKRSLGFGFSIGEKCRISSNFLPNKPRQVAKYDSKVFCGSYSKDGKFFLTASQDKLLRLYHTDDGKFVEFKKISARDVGWSILDTAFSPDGNYIVYSSWSECLYLCPVYGDSNTQESLSLCPGDRRFCIFSLVFSSDGREILGGANNGYLYVYDRECHQRAFRIEGHDDDVNTVAFADNTSQILYSAGDDGLCKVWDRRTLSETDPHPVGVLAGHMDGITYIDPRGDGRYLVTNSKDQTIKLWDVRAFSDHNAEQNTRNAVANQNWDYRWQRVPRRLYKAKNMLEGDTSIMTYRGHYVLQTLIRCHFSPSTTTGQRYIYTGCASGRVIIYDVLTGQIVNTLLGHKKCVRDVSWHPFHQEIVSTSWDGAVISWRYSGKTGFYHFESEDENDAETAPRTLRRSQRIAAQKAKHATTC